MKVYLLQSVVIISTWSKYLLLVFWLCSMSVNFYKLYESRKTHCRKYSSCYSTVQPTIYIINVYFLAVIGLKFGENVSVEKEILYDEFMIFLTGVLLGMVISIALEKKDVKELGNNLIVGFIWLQPAVGIIAVCFYNDYKNILREEANYSKNLRAVVPVLFWSSFLAIAISLSHGSSAKGLSSKKEIISIYGKSHVCSTCARYGSLLKFYIFMQLVAAVLCAISTVDVDPAQCTSAFLFVECMASHFFNIFFREKNQSMIIKWPVKTIRIIYVHRDV